MDAIETMMKSLPTLPEIQIWKEEMLNDKMTFQMEQSVFRGQFEIQKEIIRQYDVVLNEKASKHTLREIQKQLMA